ncbi:Uncharacterised protein [Campylobacter insulaenigrae]|nr:Uncharacterised protein [Campylobacter insulaenigrae]
MDFITKLIIAAIVGGLCGLAFHFWKKSKEKNNDNK